MSEDQRRRGRGLRVACVCASNMNRSVEAHALLAKRGYDVRSYGTSSRTKLPGPAADRPNVFDYGMTYGEIYAKLCQDDLELYTRNGVLSMLERNMTVKAGPERWQARANAFDVVFTFEQRVFDAVNADLEAKEAPDASEVVHVFNLATRDTHEDAMLGAADALRLLEMIDSCQEWENRLDSIVADFCASSRRPLMHSVHFY
eukprot:m51a1_g9420 hypothetical protein (202) ;mRNA; f:369007-369684